MPLHQTIGLYCAAFYALAVAAILMCFGWRALRRQGVLFTILALCFLHAAATKPDARGRVLFPYTDVENRYMFDAGSYVTNDVVHLAYTLSPIVPTTSQLVGYARPVDSTNDLDWVQMFDSTFAASPSPQDIPYLGALTNDFQFFTTWTPGPSVHTNGVALVFWQRKWSPQREDHLLSPIRTGVYLDGERIAPSPGITNAPPAALLMISPNNGGNQ